MKKSFNGWKDEKEEIPLRFYWNQTSLSYKENISKHLTYTAQKNRFYSYGVTSFFRNL